ncbi:hypothetical protein ISN45_Aa04g005030 [Arabidopsis thaliana x Arabidopsis arenosa]|uniref:Uncharacterized protein n=1 Tax=Arabidopsis thaliana x Arabidopsis arenosa TaxID=1240361 RepID=A0A8T2A381_9BRAS|nr:hypothetical protein ISN45_Aa04g005030 [Arabidopsis thaliana x Arabidopsis arenosa]
MYLIIPHSLVSVTLFANFCNLPDHHSTFPLLWFMVVGDHFIKLFRTLSHSWSSNLLDACDETYPAFLLARSLKVKFAKMLEFGLNISPASRSMESCWFASLVDHRSHWNLATLEPKMKMAAEGLTLIHQALSVLVPVTLSNWYRSPSPVSSPVPQPPAMSLSTPIICSPSPSRHTQRLIAPVKRKLGISVLGFSLYGPLCLPSWHFQVFGPIKCFCKSPGLIKTLLCPFLASVGVDSWNQLFKDNN